MTAEFTLAVHGLVYLFHKQCVVSSAELAENICTNPARVRKVMSRLNKSGLIEAFQGRGSGYRALPESGSLTLDKVLDALGEIPVAAGWRSGDIDRECLISSGMGAIISGIYDTINESCRARLSAISIESIHDKIFGKEDASRGA